MAASTHFDRWLEALRAAGKGPVNLPAASRGLAYSTTFSLPGDWTGATARAEIRAEPGSGTVLAEFSKTNEGFADGVTVFTLELSSGTSTNSTGILPSDPTGDGVVRLPYDILLTPSGGSEELLFGGIFTLLDRVTQ